MATLHSLCKALHPDDYHQMPDELARVGHARALFDGCHQFDHPHRAWEYSICLAAAGTRAELAGKRCLDVGGSYAILAGLLAWGGAEVTVTDLGDHSPWQAEMGRRAAADAAATPGGSLRFLCCDGAPPGEVYDLVTCVSVVEHNPDDGRLFRSLLGAVAPGGTLALTTDFHPSGVARIGGHVRCYDGTALEAWGRSEGFAPAGGFDYADFGGHVFGLYNFASLVLRRAP